MAAIGRSSDRVGVYVALLRGVNVGGNNMVSMKALKESFSALGFRDVATYINSGNILFRSKKREGAAIERDIDHMLECDYSLNGRTVVRDLAQMAELMTTISSTWQRRRADWRYNVIFLRREIDSADVLAGIQAKPQIEQVVYCPGTLLWSAHVPSVSRTAMAKLSSRPLYRDMTVRNVNTTTKVHELMQRMQAS